MIHYLLSLEYSHFNATARWLFHSEARLEKLEELLDGRHRRIRSTSQSHDFPQEYTERPAAKPKPKRM